MADREKVMKAIDICLGHGYCKDCEYHSAGYYTAQNCRKQMMIDVLALLKEQEAMEPIEEFRKGANCHVYHCKRCGNIVGTILGGKRPIAKLSIEHFCDVCGQAVKWE